MPSARLHSCIALLLLSGFVLTRAAVGQCLLANPSFEIAGTAGHTFAGWNQFGIVGSSATTSAPTATHGAAAARVTGPDTGDWDVSAFWQELDTAPGERWSASVRAWHSPANPLTGQCRAILNIEWRNIGGRLLAYESHTVADASTPADQPVLFDVASQPAPIGTASARLLLGVLQSPDDPAPDVLYDEATFDNLGPPTLDDRQWFDFSGGRTFEWSGRTWRVKGPGFYPPGPSFYCDTESCTWVDAENRLHLAIQNLGGSWQSSEVALQEPLGYGDYVFTTRGRLDAWDPDVVLGIFLWQYAPCYEAANSWWNPYNEIDVEFGRWGDPAREVAQFVVQPFDSPGNMNRFDATFGDAEVTSHAFRWLPDRVEFRSWRGGSMDESPATWIHTWTYAGPHLPRPEQPRVHVNLWHLDPAPDAASEVVFDEFRFVPLDSMPTSVELPDADPFAGDANRLSTARPNPFKPSTTIEYALRAAVRAEIAVYDVSGRRVRTLVKNDVAAGRHQVVWDGRDDSGDPVAAGVYLCRLRAGDALETQRLVLLR